MSRLRALVFSALNVYISRFPSHRGKRIIVRQARRILGSRWVADVGSGVLMHIHRHDYVEELILKKRYERRVKKVFTTLLESGIVVIDIGAHSGYYTLLGANRVGPHGQIHSFEPVSFLFDRLSANVHLNRLHNVRLNNVALCSTGDTNIPLYLPRGTNTGLGSFFRSNKTEQQPTLVSATSLDSYVAANCVPRVDLVKIDTEGSELLVLRGGVKVLEANKPDVICEISETHLAHAGDSAEDLDAFMGDLGYKGFYIETPWTGVHYVCFSARRKLALPLWHAAAPKS